MVHWLFCTVVAVPSVIAGNQPLASSLTSCRRLVATSYMTAHEFGYAVLVLICAQIVLRLWKPFTSENAYWKVCVVPAPAFGVAEVTVGATASAFGVQVPFT